MPLLLENEGLARHFIETGQTLEDFRFGMRYYPVLAPQLRASDKYRALLGAAMVADPASLQNEELGIFLVDPYLAGLSAADPVASDFHNLRDLAGWYLVSRPNVSPELLGEVAERCCASVAIQARGQILAAASFG